MQLLRGLPLLCSVTACGAFLSVNEAVPPPASSDDAGDVAEAGPEAGADGAAAAQDGGGDAATTDGGDSGLVECFGTPRSVFYCDAFDLPNIAAPPWLLNVAPPGDVNKAELATSTNVHLSGARAADAYVGPATGTKTAKALWTRPGGAGPLAFQLNVYIPADAWTAADTTAFAALRSATGPIGELQFKPNGNGSNGDLVLANASGTVNLGPVSVGNWSCVELEANGGTLTAFRGAIKKGSLPIAAPPVAAEIGISTALGGKVFYFDDVVLAPAAVGCLRP